MDRRFLLAVVLSAIVLIVFQMWFAPKAPPPGRKGPNQASVAESLAAAAGTTAAGTTTALAPAPAPAETAAAAPATPVVGLASGLDRAASVETTEVKTALYKAILTNRGGQLQSWKLLEYNGLGEEPVDLVPPGTDELDLTLETESGIKNLSETLFSTREETLPDGGRRVTFEAGREGGAHIIKTFTFPPRGYMVDLDVSIEGVPQATGYRLAWENGIPRAESSHKQYHSAAGTIVLLGKEKETVRPGSFKKSHEKELEGNVLWAGVRNKYFMAVMIPPEGISSRVIATGDAVKNVTGAELVMPMLHGAADHQYHVYLGPMDYASLKDLDHHLEQAVDLGWKIFRPISKLLLAVMVWMYGFIPNYGVVIIIISVATKLLFYPLTKSSVKSMRNMQRIQPEMQAIKEKYKNDSQRQQKEMMELYKKHKVNPMGGCLPILVQMPVFVALYAVLANSITMRGADFALWMNDLSSPDTIATVGGFAIHVLPFILFLTTVAQQMLTPTAGDPRQKMIGYMMPLVMLFIFYSFPAGLNLYWTVNNILTVAQQWIIHREEAVPAPAASTA
jgi:YidC/Oxa1 family membrane protein insertase